MVFSNYRCINDNILERCYHCYENFLFVDIQRHRMINSLYNVFLKSQICKTGRRKGDHEKK